MELVPALPFAPAARVASGYVRDLASSDPPVGRARARRNERLVYLASHPIPVALGELAATIGPVVRVPGIGAFVTDVEVAREVLSNPDRFSKTGPGAVGAILTEVMGPHALLNMEGPDHRALRGRLAGLFTARFVHDLVRQVFEPKLKETRVILEAGGELDLARLARILTGRMVCAMLGAELPEGREDETCLDLYRTGVELGSVATLAGRTLDPERLAFAKNRFAELTRIAKDAYERGGEESVPGRLRSLGLSFEEARGVIGVLFLAGMETTSSALPRIAAILMDGGHWERVNADRALLPKAIDEGIRVTSPVPVMTRSATADTVLGGKKVKKDERVVVFMYDLVRSKAYGAHPREFDLDRPIGRDLAHLWFGYGPHFCLGFSLARREIELVLETLLDAGELEVTGRTYGRKVLFPAYESLCVRRVRGRSTAPDARKSKSVRVGA